MAFPTGRRLRWTRQSPTRLSRPSYPSRSVCNSTLPRHCCGVLSHLPWIDILTASRHHPLSLRRASHAALHSHPGTTASCEEGCWHTEQRDQRPVHCYTPQQHPQPTSGALGSSGAARIVSDFTYHVRMQQLTIASNFKSIPQLATPPPESPTKQVNGTSSRVTSLLSPFAAMLLKDTDVAYSRK